MRRLFALILAALAPAASAAEVALTDEVEGRPGLTYEALLRQALPGLVRTEGGWTAGAAPGLRNTDGDPADVSDLVFEGLQAEQVKGETGPVLLLLTQSPDNFTAVLAAFDLAPATPKLLDALDAGLDRRTDLGETLDLGPQDAFALKGTHRNSSESYEIAQLFFLRNGKLTPILAQLGYGVRMCGWGLTQQISLKAEMDSGRPMRAIRASVRQEVTQEKESPDCGDEPPPPKSGDFSDLFRWNAEARAYEAVSTHLEGIYGPE